MPPRLYTAPASEPITLVEAKAHLRLEVGDDDTYLTTLITAARQWAEEYCWRGLVTQTWDLILESFPCSDEIELPKGVLSSVTSVSYRDVNGDSHTWSSSNYLVDTAHQPGRIHLPYGSVWPATICRWDAVTIRYVVGTAAGSVPAPIKQAMLLLISQMYEHRTPEVFGILAKVQFAVDALLAPYRLARFL